MATSLAVRPGRAVITAIRVDRYTDSYTLQFVNKKHGMNLKPGKS